MIHKRSTRPYLSNSLLLVVLAVIVAGAAIRVALISRGQYLFPDEARYDRCLDFWDAFFELEPARAVTLLFKAKGRPGAVVTYLPISLVQWTVNRMFSLQAIQTSWLPALFTAALAALNTILFHRLCRRVLDCPTASTLGAILYGLCAPALYFAQFLLPYIAAQTYFLAALLLVSAPSAKAREPNAATESAVAGPHGSRPLGAARWALGGILFGLAFATYPGIYDQVLTLLAVSLLSLRTLTAKSLVRLSWIPAGACLVVTCFEAFSRLGWGPTYLASLHDLSGLINQGDFNEVWKFPLLFLWSADRAFTVVLAVGLTGAAACLATRKSPLRRPLGILVVTLSAWYLWRVIDGWRGSQVLYGRLVFQVLPLGCLVAAGGLSHLFGKGLQSPRRLMLSSVLMSAWAMANIWPYLHTVTPAKFEHDWLADHPNSQVVAYVTSLVGTRMMAPDHHELDDRLRRYQAEASPGRQLVVFANTQPMLPVLGFCEPAELDTLSETPHPLNIPALQFEGLNAAERSTLQGQTLWMRALAAPPPHAAQESLNQWAGHKTLP